MSHSNSSLNCFATCMKKYELQYVKKLEPDKGPSPHLVFGTMAHSVLEKAGLKRDEVKDGVVDVKEYDPIIPSELMFPELKEYFGITSWSRYFYAVIRQVTEYEKKLCDDYKYYEVKREVKLQMSPNELAYHYGIRVSQPLVGVVDLLILSKGRDETYDAATIIDYKFSTGRKDQNDFDMNSQLFLYAALVHNMYGVPLRNIVVGYIDIPKKEFEKPVLLSGGTLSRSKSQNCSAEMYKKSVIAIHGDDPYYNCEPGGYYYNCYMELQNNKAAYLSSQYLDTDIMKNVLDDVLTAAEFADIVQEKDYPYLRKYDSYSCKSCEYLKQCKPWLGVDQWDT